MKVLKEPYNHFIQYDFLPSTEFRKLNEDLPKLRWELYQKKAYEYWISALDYKCCYYLENTEILDKFLSISFIKKLSFLFNVSLSTCKDATFHKMSEKHFSRRHNDANESGEKVRLVYYFTSPTDYEGGELSLYFEDNDDAIWNTYKFPPNTVFGFLMCKKSFHEANRIKQGERICLVFTYS